MEPTVAAEVRDEWLVQPPEWAGAAWWADPEKSTAATEAALHAAAKHLAACVDLGVELSEEAEGETRPRCRVPQALLAEWSLRSRFDQEMAGHVASLREEMGIQEMAEAADEHLPIWIKKRRSIAVAQAASSASQTPLLRRDAADASRSMDRCARCRLPFKTRRGAMTLRMTRDRLLVARCSACSELHQIGLIPDLAELRQERTAAEDCSYSTPSAPSNLSSSLKRMSMRHSSTTVASSPLLQSKSAKKKKRGSQLERMLRENEAEKERREKADSGGLAGFLASLAS